MSIKMYAIICFIFAMMFFQVAIMMKKINEDIEDDLNQIFDDYKED